MKKAIKLLIISIFLILTFSCQKELEVTKIELRLEYVDFYTKEVYMKDTKTMIGRVIKYDENLFQMTFVQLLQLRGHPIFTFYECDGLLYHT